MHTKKECLELINSIRETAADPYSAYLLRTRVKRALLSTIRLAANYASVEMPSIPGTFKLPTGAPKRSVDLINSCNNLLANTRKLCQPSEALDTRWTRGWAEVVSDLSIVERLLKEWPES